MPSIQYLLNYLIRLTVFLVIFLIFWWILAVFFPAVSFRNLFSVTGTSTTESLLPSPMGFKGIFGKSQTPGATDNVYKPGEAFNGYGNAFNNNQGGAQVDFITYTSTGTQVIHNGIPYDASNQSSGSSQTTNGYAKKELYIRNLSMYEKGHVYTGLAFIGEARNTMFVDGKFPILVADPAGRVVSLSYAVATTDWTVAGWTKFQVRIEGSMPSNIPCTMVFQQNLTPYQYSLNYRPINVAIPVICN